MAIIQGSGRLPDDFSWVKKKKENNSTKMTWENMIEVFKIIITPTFISEVILIYVIEKLVNNSEDINKWLDSTRFGKWCEKIMN